MSKFTNILFDLDGTLIDPFVGITKSIEYALEKFDVFISDNSKIAVHIGTPLRDIFVKLLDTNEQIIIEQAVTFYRERYSTIGLWENELYPGVIEMLEALINSSHNLYIATSKPQIFAQKILQFLSLDRYFVKIFGSELNGKYDRKADLIKYLLNSENLSAAETIMIGDRHHDILGARKNQITSIGVTYGYGTSAELIAAGATYLCNNPIEIVTCIKNS